MRGESRQSSKMAAPGVQQQQGAGANVSQGPTPGVGGGGADVDPITKFRMLVPLLKDSLATVMRVGAQILQHDAQVDNCLKSADGPVQRFDKCLEEFHAICDQMELNLKLAQDCIGVSADSLKNCPVPIQTGIAVDPGEQQRQTYSMFLIMVKHQITCAKEIHDALLECARDISKKPV
ncbi:mediator of RNA polymerase II transcription subunit 29 [Lingula anatina]|uniref:Mediator of RNA polymerase II transcription subunit 29 n=1 Tax=Lingula anatina TaxID=7574 RepID=A0A1S3HJQ5_LINAN|nr:mediator of RNA polymerase II transcription subunit 29 [Lingula anatina]|eukprot:XP_013385686.1 mediator of RNA polymerase II transcription subunit 29 [Lingula anatina]